MKPLLRLLPILALATCYTPSFAVEKDSISLPFNEYNALVLLAKWKVSTSELPLYIDTEIDDLYGADNNQNQVRDDYEQMLLSTYQRPEYVVMGLLAAKEWNRLMDIYTNTLAFENVSQARSIFSESSAINRCYFQLQAVDSSLISPVLAYFNTEERLSAKEVAEEKLLSLIGEQHNSLSFNTQPCSVFTSLLKTALGPNLNLASGFNQHPDPSKSQQQ